MRGACALKHLGPLLVVWGASMVLLVFIRDLGSSLMFFGGFLALVYVATNRLSFVAIGARRCSPPARVLHEHRRPRAATASTRGSTRSTASCTQAQIGGSYQIAQSLFAQADGGLFGTGFGQALLDLPGGGAHPARRRDRPHLRAHHQRARAGRRGRADRRLPAHRRARLQDRDARRRTRSPSCWRPA